MPGVFIGALLCDKLGRKNTMMLGFSGYGKLRLDLSPSSLMLTSEVVVFGLIIGCAYDKITNM